MRTWSKARGSQLLKLREEGWTCRGYLPHFDGYVVPQMITLHLVDSIPKKVIRRWQAELDGRNELTDRIVLAARIDRYLDRGFGSCYLRDTRIARIVQDSLLKFHDVRYQLIAWVVMPNHTHFLLERFENWRLEQLLHTHKSYTAHEANKVLQRSGQFWMDEYFDRRIRDDNHYRKAIGYIENNPVKAGLCKKASDWPFSSASYWSGRK